jgi:hypothetical protein
MLGLFRCRTTASPVKAGHCSGDVRHDQAHARTGVLVKRSSGLTPYFRVHFSSPGTVVAATSTGRVKDHFRRQRATPRMSTSLAAIG